MLKWNPVYRLTVYTNHNTPIITLPITLNANITKSIVSSNSNATFELYNLSPETRENIHQAPFLFASDKAKFVTLEAGYGDINSVYLLFKGAIMQAYSTKAGGATDVITKIEAKNLDVLTAQSSQQFAAGTSIRDVIKSLISDMPNCSMGELGAVDGELLTPTTYDGLTIEQLQKISGGNTFVDDGKVNTILGNECIDAPVLTVTDNNGILRTPVRNAANLSVSMLFEPSIVLGQLIDIETSIMPEYNGYYKVLGITHNLHFSEATDGQRTTDLMLWSSKLLQNTPLSVSGSKPQETVNKVKNETVTPVEEEKSNISFIKPVNGVITSKYGNRLHPIFKTYKFHTGIDYGVPMNTPVKATADGTIVSVGVNGGYGKMVKISHGKLNGKSLQSWYAHLNSFATSAGRKVRQGEIIGYSGKTGYATGPHLHFEIRENQKSVDPKKYV